MNWLKELLRSKRVQNSLKQLSETLEKRKHELVFFNEKDKVWFYFVRNIK